ncbi:hypothetical protein CYLTODRAFT_416431 [Cylindrobasidium torrendii FP15055 ss-10]|uniref:BTB domain-containing protein n=1 Tax=Cylindrobasidium torrendii FP15055 ss-10 TaxID=1314674 RepID=A0A0D7BVI4_9AGAR|nr:hypothetical protein CYLTODRAFT_416431 [Cylindrobasidium torrendii FP15055 ss-10]
MAAVTHLPTMPQGHADLARYKQPALLPSIDLVKTFEKSYRPAYHPAFDSARADIVLQSSDGVLYRIRSYTLRRTSGFFRTMFTLPQPSSISSPPCSPASDSSFASSSATVCDEEEEHIPVHEPSKILTPLLLLLLGRETETPIHHWSFDKVESVLRLAESWDMPGPISLIRLAITAPVFLQAEPLRVFAIASQFEWEEEKACAARHTLRYDLLADRSLRSTLDRLSARDVLQLLRVRRARVEGFRALVDDVHRFSAGNNDSYDCGRCSNSKLDNQTWKDLKQTMVQELEKRPLGDSVGGWLVGGIGARTGLGVMAWKEAEACWMAKCQNPECGSANYDRLTTLKQVRQCVDELTWI